MCLHFSLASLNTLVSYSSGVSHCPSIPTPLSHPASPPPGLQKRQGLWRSATAGRGRERFKRTLPPGPPAWCPTPSALGRKALLSPHLSRATDREGRVRCSVRLTKPQDATSIHPVQVPTLWRLQNPLGDSPARTPPVSGHCRSQIRQREGQGEVRRPLPYPL